MRISLDPSVFFECLVKYSVERDGSIDMTLAETIEYDTRTVSNRISGFFIGIIDFIFTWLANFAIFMVQKSDDNTADLYVVQQANNFRYFAIQTQINQYVPATPKYLLALINYSEQTPYSVLLKPLDKLPSDLPSTKAISDTIFKRDKFIENTDDASLLFLFFCQHSHRNVL